MMPRRMRRLPSTCRWCYRPFQADSHWLQATRDHVIAESRGGHSHKSNLVWACRACNELKGDLHPRYWFAMREAMPNWWRLAEVPTPRGAILYLHLIALGMKLPPMQARPSEHAQVRLDRLPALQETIDRLCPATRRAR